MLCHDLHSPDVGSGAQNRALNSRVRHAAAKVAVHVRDNFCFGRVGVFSQQHRGLHDLPRLTVAALRNLFGDPSALKRVIALRIEAFDGDDRLANISRKACIGRLMVPSRIYKMPPCLMAACRRTLVTPRLSKGVGDTIVQ